MLCQSSVHHPHHPERLNSAGRLEKDPRLVEVVLWDTVDVVRASPNALIVRHRLGFVSANGGVDSSNVDFPDRQRALRLPEDPDRSARQIRSSLLQSLGASPAVIISDSHGRPLARGHGRRGHRAGGNESHPRPTPGKPDLYGRKLQITIVGLADQVAAAAASLVIRTGRRRGAGRACPWIGNTNGRKRLPPVTFCDRRKRTCFVRESPPVLTPFLKRDQVVLTFTLCQYISLAMLKYQHNLITRNNQMEKPRFSVTHKDELMAELIRKTDQKTLAVWAIDCVERVLLYF